MYEKYLSHGGLRFISEFGLSYGTKEEYKFRLEQFIKSEEKIRKINSETENTFTAGHNQFSTWTQDEY